MALALSLKDPTVEQNKMNQFLHLPGNMTTDPSNWEIHSWQQLKNCNMAGVQKAYVTL